MNEVEYGLSEANVADEQAVSARTGRNDEAVFEMRDLRRRAETVFEDDGWAAAPKRFAEDVPVGFAQ